MSIQDGTAWEEGLYTYTNSGTTLARTVFFSSSTGSALNVTTSATVFCVVPDQIVLGMDTALRGSIVGLQPTWVSTTQLGVGPGSAYIEGLSSVLGGSPANITPGSPAASTWYHVYLYSSDGTLNGTPTLEASTTAPVAFATPVGFARSKSGDTSRRYLYSALTDGSSHFYRFACDQSGLFRWFAQNVQAAPFRVLSAGTAASSTAVDCSGAVPTTARTVYIQVQDLPSGSGNIFIGSADYTVTSTAFELELAAGLVGGTAVSESEETGFVGCSSSQNINYLVTASQSAYINVFGFMLQR
jgi:hypothetical protein